MARKSVKGSTPEVPQAALKVKKTICLDVDMASRLGSFAGHYRVAESKVVADALEVHLAGYVSYHKHGQIDKAEPRDVRIAGSTAVPTRESA